MTAGAAAAGTEPAMHGSVRMVRTFALSAGGALTPVTGRPAWTDGINTAACIPTHGSPAPSHDAPAPGCHCGLWGYGSLQALRESGLAHQARTVAVVACHGTVIPGTLGARAQHAILEAVWVSPAVSDEVRAALAARYPLTAVYRSLPAMLGEHPLTVLPSYRLPEPPSRSAAHRQLLVTLAWWLVMLAWAALSLPRHLAAANLPVTSSDITAVTVPAVIGLLGASLPAAPSPRVRRWAPVALFAMTTAALIARVGGMNEWLAMIQLDLLVGSGTLHLVIAARTWRHLRLAGPAVMPGRRPLSRG